MLLVGSLVVRVMHPYFRVDDQPLLIDDFVISIDLTMFGRKGCCTKALSRRYHQHLQPRRRIWRAFQVSRVLGFDTETTGLDPRKDRIVQYAFVGVDEDGQKIVIDSLVDPCMAIPLLD